VSAIVVPVTTGFMSWRTLREACARIIEAAAPNARVHDTWKLKTDFAKSVAILKPITGADAGKVQSVVEKTFMKSNLRYGDSLITRSVRQLKVVKTFAKRKQNWLPHTSPQIPGLLLIATLVYQP
jgi:hypothetical protein